MERACFTFEIYPHMIDEYKKRHDEIWPELVEVIENAGLKNYSLFRRDTTVIAYVECHPDIATAFGKVGESEVNTRWSKWFEEVILELTDDNGDLLWADEVWHLD